MTEWKTDREPCPYRIVEDSGGAFVFGLVGGFIWHSIGGAKNAPSGQMIEQSISRVKARVPMLGGSFAVWGTLFSCCDCTITSIRKKEDPWNAIASGAITGGLLAARAGLKAMGRNALAGGVILAAIEGMNLMLMRVIMPSFEAQQLQAAEGGPDRLLPPIDPARMEERRRLLAAFGNNYDGSTNKYGSSSNSNSSGSTSSSGFALMKSLFESGSPPTPLYSSENTSTSASSSSGGFDVNSVLQTENEKQRTEDNESSNNSADQESKKPFWKLW